MGICFKIISGVISFDILNFKSFDFLFKDINDLLTIPGFTFRTLGKF